MPSLYRRVVGALGQYLTPTDVKSLRRVISQGIAEGHYGRDRFGLNSLIHRLQTVELMADAVSPDRSISVALMLAPLAQSGFLSQEDILNEWGDDISAIVGGLIRVDSL